VRLLLDTHVLLWAAAEPQRLSSNALSLLASADNDLVYSAASLWEAAIKSSLGRPDFTVQPQVLRRRLLEAGYEELAITGEHALLTASLPLLHRDPFDRLLVAQATVEGITLLTADEQVARYPGPIRRI